MKITDPINYIVLGGQIRYFAGSVEDDLIFGEHRIYENLKTFSDNLDSLGFQVSKNLFDARILPLQREFESLKELADEENDLRLTMAQSESLQKYMLAIEDTVFAEANTRVIASPMPRRFELNHLLKNHGSILGKGVFEKLTTLAQSDISSACKCIAFECPTAAAFHILRALEECVRVIYKAYFPKGNEKRPWGVLTNELKTKPKKPKPDDLILIHLDHLRTRFRNPTDHPEKIYEIEESEDLVHVVVEIINRIIKDQKVSKLLS